MSIPANERNIGMILGKCDVKSEWDKNICLDYSFDYVCKFIKDNYRCEPDIEILYECLGYWFCEEELYYVKTIDIHQSEGYMLDININYYEEDYDNYKSMFKTIIIINHRKELEIRKTCLSGLLIDGQKQEDNKGVLCRWTKKDGWKSVDGDTDDESEEEDC